MLTPFQVATSSSTRVVESETSETWPPMIPAIPEGPLRSQTSTDSASKRALDPVEGGHLLALGARCGRSARRPGTRSRSKACSGCAVSSIT